MLVMLRDSISNKRTRFTIFFLFLAQQFTSIAATQSVL